MPEGLNGSKIYVGLKQSTEAIINGKVQKAYVARDADDCIRVPFVELCREHIVPFEYVETKKELGKACGINVGAACAVLLSE